MNIRRRLHFRILPVLLLVTLLTACADRDLNTVAKALNDTAHGVGVLQTTAIEANKQNLLSENVTRQILQAALKVDLAGKEAVSITRGINALAPADRTNLLAILNPVIASLADVDTQIVFGIKDPKTQQNIRAIFVLIQTALNTAQLALAAR